MRCHCVIQSPTVKLVRDASSLFAKASFIIFLTLCSILSTQLARSFILVSILAQYSLQRFTRTLLQIAVGVLIESHSAIFVIFVLEMAEHPKNIRQARVWTEYH